MSAEIIPFDFDKNAVRVVMQEGDPWFVAADVCRVLEISNGRDAVARLDEDEKAMVNLNTVGNTDSIRGNPNARIISESGLYALILTSRKAEARKFRKWVTAEVLPRLRTTGHYEVEGAQQKQPPLPDFSNPADAARAWAEQYEAAASAQVKVEQLLPKEAALERISMADGSMTITSTAKLLQMRPKDLFQWLREKGWIYKRTGSGVDLGYQRRVQVGYLEHKTTLVARSDGSEKVTEQVRVTPKGLSKLAQSLYDEGLVSRDAALEGTQRAMRLSD